MAKLMEDKFSAMRSIASQPMFPWPQAHVSPPIIHRFVALPIKCLTLIEMAAWREKGHMFNYDSKFTPCHKCNPALFLCLLIEQKDSGDNTRSSEEDPPIGSSAATSGQWHQHTLGHRPSLYFVSRTDGKLVPSTLKIASSINGWDVIVLVDGGSKNNFIQLHLATTWICLCNHPPIWVSLSATAMRSRAVANVQRWSSLWAMHHLPLIWYCYQSIVLMSC